MAIGGNNILAALSVRLTTDASQFKKGLDDSQKKMKGLGQSAGALQSKLIAAFSVAAIGAFIKSSAQAWDKQMQAEAGLLNALKGRKDIQSDLLKQASEIQSRSLFGDEEIIAQQKYLASMKLSKRQIMDTTEAAVQLSAALGISLESATKNLAKTYGGLTGELGELLPQLKDLTTEQLKSGEAIKFVNDNYQGFAETAASVGLGSLKQLSNSFGDFKETIAEYFAPDNNDFVKGLQNRIEGLTAMGKSFNDLKEAARETGKEFGWFTELFAKWGKYNKEALEIISAYEDKLLAARLATIDLSKAEEPQIALLAKINEKIKQQRELRDESLTEADFSKRNRLLHQLEEEKKKLLELGKIPKAPAPLKNNVKIDDVEADLSADIIWPDEYEWNRTWENMLEGISKFRDGYTVEMQQIAEMNSIIENGMENMVDSFAQSMGALIAGSKNFDLGTALLTPIADMIGQLGKMLIATGIGIQAFKKSLMTLNPVIVTTAGIALVALSAAIKQGISNMANAGAGAAALPTNTTSATTNTDTTDRYARQFGQYNNKMQIEIVGRMSGNDILFTNQRALNNLSVIT